MNDNIEDRPRENRVDARREFLENGSRNLPWYNEHLPHERRGIQLGSKITSLRNHAICALFVQLVSTVAGFSLFFARRVLNLEILLIFRIEFTLLLIFYLSSFSLLDSMVLLSFKNGTLPLISW